jgi:hypothetical protein
MNREKQIQNATSRVWEILERRLAEAIDATCGQVMIQQLEVDRNVTLLETNTIVIRIIPKAYIDYVPINMAAFEEALRDAQEELSKAILGKEYLP